jgi:hypothetical protein
MTTIMSQTDEQKEAEIERRAQQRVAQLLDANTLLPDIIAASVERAMRRVMSDQTLREDFWRSGYVELEKHAGTNAANWLGRRIVNIVVTAAVAGLLAWAVMTGKAK